MHACDQVLHTLLIFSHPLWATFLFCLFLVCKGIVSLSDLGHIVDISVQLLLILEDGEPTRLHFAALFMVHFVVDLPENVSRF